jgi:hypothetical protein
MRSNFTRKNIMQNRTTSEKLSLAWRRALPGGLVLASGLVLGACDLNVSNPGMIEGSDLDDPKALSALVAGVTRDYAYAAIQPGGGGLLNAGAMLTDELVHNGTWVGLRGLSDGMSKDDWVEAQSRWAEASQARWVAEQGIERISGFSGQEGADEDAIQEALATVNMWGGHANRLLGDSFCNAVIDGGPLEEHTVYYTRAVERFTDAIALAEQTGQEDVQLTALGGRAFVRMMQGDWAGAVADAGKIPTDFVFEQVHTESNGVSNRFYWWGFRRNETTVWGTPFEAWGLNKSDPNSTGDPRVTFDVAMEDGEVVLGGDDHRPFYRQLKYGSYGDDIAVVKGTEMRLIEAEAALVQSGEFATVESKINEVRTFHDLPTIEINSVEEAWAALQKERGLELWLEGRRLPDFRRWAQNPGYVVTSVVREEAAGQPASADPVRNALDTQVMTEIGDMCLMVSKEERDSNPNIP